ncbi:PepSY domain-containing protein [Achromobacter sp. Marseille-Q0513]|uniref:PepSY-associated TM helix domain-containing protein n=1 Tax=Achromobacter sp. Marseille-Q0513 TaxID=2829161 RepID=UPI001B947F80|nr:PepSY-associated TM helix domain-containing protein [Achromobacter sp. Marseille-Q0513]MBR8656497.1 PepSY domain-containing protein [Achromobacter sp. Marseille-Q0513]
MAWLHTWAGLWFSWLLYAVFLTGTLAVFSEAISHWMNPEHAIEEARTAQREAPTVDRSRRLDMAVQYMSRNHGGANMWEIWPVNRHHDNGLVAYWFDQNHQYADAELDPDTGEPLPEEHHGEGRQTAGGAHFVNFHYTLHSPGIGLWIVALAGMAMLVALVSGIITHKRIFKDFFTFRSGKGQRSWLDAHNAAAVLTLPFQFMIAYTGIVISSLTLMPAPIAGVYGTGPDAERQYLAEYTGDTPPARTGQPLAVPALEPIVARAEKLIGQEARAIVITHPEDGSMRIGVYGWNEDAETRSRISSTTGMAEYSAATGELLRSRPAGGVAGGAPSLLQQAMSDLHMVKFGGLAMKWLYFVCGLAGAAMMGTGAVLFMVKRRTRMGDEFGAATARMYRLIEGLNVAALAGLGIACIAYFWANRLLPVALEQRAAWEIRAFFGAWALTLLHAWLCSPRRAWIIQLSLLAALCLPLPALSPLAVGDHLAAQIARDDWESAGVELATLAFGMLAAWGAWRVARRKPAAARPARGATPAAPASIQEISHDHA